MQNSNVISKGSYSTFRFNEFVSVRQYLLIREKGKKYLILKLSNDAKETVTGLTLTVEQMDVRGVCIETNRIEWDNVNGKPGTKFIPPDKIPLREGCVEVKVNLVGAVYGEYTYTVKSNELVVVYDKKAEENDEDYSLKTGGERVVTNKRKFKTPVSIVAAALSLLFITLIFTLVQLYQFKKTEKEFLWKGIEYEFITNDKDEGAPIRVVGYNGKQTEVVIPQNLEGYVISEISEKAFRDNTTLRTLTIEARIDLPRRAFVGCTQLETVQMPGVTQIGEEAFYGCYNIQSVTATNLNEIGKAAFSGCNALTSVHIENASRTLTVGREAFAYCNALETMYLNQRVKFPEAMDMFKGVYSIRYLTLNHYNSEKLDGVTNKKLSALFSSASNMSGLKELTIYDIDAIPKSFCEGADSLEKVSLSGLSSTVLGSRAFYQCNWLTDLSLSFEEKGAKITEVKDYALYQTKISTFDGEKLTEIGEGAFAENKKLTSVNVKDNKKLNSLGESAFKGCTALQTFHLSSLVTRIPERAFEGCTSLRAFTLGNGSQLSVVEPFAFNRCEKLEAIQFPTTMKTIQESAFEGCSSLIEVSMAQGLEVIEENAFYDCSSLKNVKIPKSVITIGMGIFEQCGSLESLETPFVGCGEAYPFLAAMFGADEYYYASQVPSTLRSVTVTGDENVADYAFYSLAGLKQVSLNGSINSIGMYAFDGCRNLRELHLSVALTNVGENAFSSCYLLFEIWNPSVLPIVKGGWEYGGMARYALAVYRADDERGEVVETDGFRFLEAEDNWYLTDYVGESAEWELPSSFANAKGATVMEYALVSHLFEGRQDVEKVTISKAVKSMGELVFSECSQLTKVSYESSAIVSTIPAFTYAYCYSLKEVNIPSNCQIVSMGDNAFAYCSQLTSISLPNALHTLGSYVFSGCSGLTELSIGQNVESIGWGALYSTDGLRKLTVPFIGGSQMDNTYLGYIFGKNAYDGCSQTLEKVTVLSAENIPENAFYSFTQLQAVQFGGTVETIGESAFAYCHALETISFTMGLRKIYAHAFANSGLKTVSLPYGLQSIGVNAFYNTSLQSVALPTTVQTLGSQAFAECGSLQTVNMNNVQLTAIPTYAFYNCYNLSLVNMNSASICEIGAYAFSSTKLTAVELPTYVTMIGEYAFAYCESLAVVTIPSMVTEIQSDAFYSCNELYEVYNKSDLPITRGSYEYGNVAYNAVIVHTSIYAKRLAQATVNGLIFKYAETEGEACVIGYQGSPKTLTFSAVTLNGQTYSRYWIYREVFEGCSSIEEVDTGVVNEIGSYAFYYCNNLKKVTVRNILQKVADTAFQYCERLWEVQDQNNTFDLYCGDTQCGYVAYYAVAINQQITYEKIGNFEFMNFGGKTYLYGYTGSYNAELPDIGRAYEIYKHEKFSEIFGSWHNYLVIPTSVSYIQKGAISNYIARIYYKGTAAAWTSVAVDTNYPTSNVYYYNICVHNSYLNTKYWTYKNNVPSSGDTALKEVTQASTCQTGGVRIFHCDVCNQDLYEESLPLVSHSFTGVNGECTWCKQVPVAARAFGQLVLVENDSVYRFFIDKNKDVYSDWRNDYDDGGWYQTEFRIVAQANVELSAIVSSVCTSGGECEVLLNNETVFTLSGKNSKTLDLELEAGDVVTFIIYRWNDASSENKLYVKDVTVTEIVETGEE